VRRKDWCWFVRLAYDPKELPTIMIARHRVVGGVTIGIRVDHCSFMGTYESVEKDTVAYGSGTWVRMHDA
jgi:hypothetical protein